MIEGNSTARTYPPAFGIEGAELLADLSERDRITKHSNYLRPLNRRSWGLLRAISGHPCTVDGLRPPGGLPSAWAPLQKFSAWFGEVDHPRAAGDHSTAGSRISSFLRPNAAASASALRGPGAFRWARSFAIQKATVRLSTPSL